MAGSSTVWSVDSFKDRGTFRIYRITWTADDADGSVPAAITASDVYGFVELVITNPGAVAPTANYDIVITDEEGCDVLGGEGADRSATVSEQVFPKAGNAYGKRPVNGK